MPQIYDTLKLDVCALKIGLMTELNTRRWVPTPSIFPTFCNETEAGWPRTGFTAGQPSASSDSGAVTAVYEAGDFFFTLDTAVYDDGEKVPRYGRHGGLGVSLGLDPIFFA